MTVHATEGDRNEFTHFFSVMDMAIGSSFTDVKERRYLLLLHKQMYFSRSLKFLEKPSSIHTYALLQFICFNVQVSLKGRGMQFYSCGKYFLPSSKYKLIKQSLLVTCQTWFATTRNISLWTWVFKLDWKGSNDQFWSCNHLCVDSKIQQRNFYEKFSSVSF